MVKKKTIKIVSLTQINSPKINALSASSADSVNGFTFEEDCNPDVIHGKSVKSNMNMGSGKSYKGSTYGSGKSRGSSHHLGQTQELNGDKLASKGSSKSGSGSKKSGKSNMSIGSGKSSKGSESGTKGSSKSSSKGGVSREDKVVTRVA